MKKIAIFTSGQSRGSNFLAIFDYILKNGLEIEISYLFITDKSAPIAQLAVERNIQIVHYCDQSIKLNDFLVQTCFKNPVDLIVLCGFMRKLSQTFFQKIKIPIINIHPALLPKYGGKGMFGMNVHMAVFENGEAISGATVHFVNEKYDDGEIIIQKECDISKCNSPSDVSKAVLAVEHEIYPQAIEKLLRVK